MIVTLSQRSSRHRHHAYPQLAGLAAAANPLLRRPAAAVALAVERWADEDAARAAGDRTTVARALARAGLARAGAPLNATPTPPTPTTPTPPTPTATVPTVGQVKLGAADTHIGQRVRALLGPPPPARPLLRVAVAALALATAASAVDASHVTERRFEHALHTHTRTYDRPG